MRKKIQDFSQDFKMPHLFREDLESIENIIKSLSPKYELETKDFEYNSVQEISKDIDPVNNFHIKMFDPYVSIDFSKNDACIYTSDDDVKTIGVVKKITDIILKRERKCLYYFSSLSTYLPSILFFLTFLGKEVIKSNKILFLANFVLLFAVAWWIFGFYVRLYNFSVVEFAYRKNKSNFFDRNKDQIIVGIIVAIATVFLTLLLQKIFK